MKRLSSTTGWILLGLWLGITGRAHELTVAWTVRAGELEIHGTTDGTPAAGATVELRAGDDTVLTSGKLDASGRFRSPLPAVDRLSVVVDAGFGHRRTVTLSAKDLRGGSPGTLTSAHPAAHTHAHPHPQPRSAGETRGRSDAAVGPMVRIGLGVTFLLALAAASMSYGNMRRLANLERRLPPDASRG
ncbi:MAG: hypothetical protein HS113_10345 [Verrucomicrobiales bacterium]|nr:hypothetical protein [Verrucomicrobiales bacterium]